MHILLLSMWTVLTHVHQKFQKYFECKYWYMLKCTVVFEGQLAALCNERFSIPNVIPPWIKKLYWTLYDSWYSAKGFLSVSLAATVKTNVQYHWHKGSWVMLLLHRWYDIAHKMYLEVMSHRWSLGGTKSACETRNVAVLNTLLRNCLYDTAKALNSNCFNRYVVDKIQNVRWKIP